MFIDLNQAESNSLENTADICICGAGVAGITLALELSRNYHVVLLEAGDFEYSVDSQSLYLGDIVGREYFDLAATRLRYFGGTSNHWAGWCRPLDEHDFHVKPYQDYSGWPIGREDLASYEPRAREILDIVENPPPPDVSPDDIEEAIRQSADFDHAAFWWSPPTRFGQKYREPIETNPRITCYLNANVVDITLRDSHSSVESLTVRDYSGRDLNLRTGTVILATGGIENPRLLLNCDKQAKDGLGNDNDLVGRFFSEHLHHHVGDFILEDRVKARIDRTWNWSDIRNAGDRRRFFSPSPAFMEREQILNFGLRFQPKIPGYWDIGFRAKLKDLVCEFDLLKAAAGKIQGQDVSCRSADMFDGTLRIASEQTPNRSSTVALGSELDRLGMRKTVLDWRISYLDTRTIRRAVLNFGQAFAELDLGRVRIADWLQSDEIELPDIGEDEVAGHHHMCTTRMGTAPSDGVVDANQKVFELDNLYVAGSSVFSTGGHANPTFTIVQMSLRLADHLRSLARP